MFYKASSNWITALGLSALAGFSVITHAVPLTGGVDVGAEVRCDYINNESPVTSEGPEMASCTALGDTQKASADLLKAEVKVFASQPEQTGNYLGSDAAFVDSITVTEGWDSNGEVTATFQLDVEGMIDTGNVDNQSEVNFFIAVWYPSDPTPPCIDDADDCGFTPDLGPGAPNPSYPYDYAEVWFDLFDGTLDADIYSGGTGSGLVLSEVASDLRATLSVTLTVDEDNPSFYVSVYAFSGGFGAGTSDFFNTAKAGLLGPVGFTYSSKNGFASQVDDTPSTEGPVELNGRVQLADGTDLCAMVLASGQFMFTCEPSGAYSLTDLPREPNGTVNRQVYVDGTFPSVDVLPDSVNQTVIQKPAFDCPKYNPPSNPGTFPESAGQQHSISGRVLDRDTDTSICAMVLANGQYVFTCDGSGSYALEFPLDSNGQYQLQVYADGFAPTLQTFDEMSAGGDVRMARASECR